MAEISSPIQTLLARNQVFRKAFTPPPTISQYAAHLASTPSAATPRICIITCCDPRVIPEYIFGLSLGEATVMRTAGGSIRPAIGGLLAIDSVGPITDLVVMRHTDCGTTKWVDQDVRATLQARRDENESEFATGQHQSLDAMDFCESIGDEHTADEAKLREDLRWLKESSLVRKEITIAGMVYETASGKIRVISQETNTPILGCTWITRDLGHDIRLLDP